MTDAEGAVRMSTRKMKDSGVAWLEKIPEGWQVYPLKYGFDFSKGLNITKADLTEKGVPVISYGQIHSKRNTGTHLSDELLRYVPCEFVQSDPAAVLQKNDFVFADTSEDLEGLGNCVFIDREDTVMAGYHAIVLRPSIDAEHKYLAYLFKTDCWRRQIRELAYGIKVYSLSQKILRQCSILLPPLPEQRRIAAYLDDRCARIDSVIETTKKTIEDYKALKQSIIFEAVTGKNAGGKMKDSGVEWIGAMPEGWKVTKIGRVGRTSSGATPFRGNESEYFDNATIRWVKTLDLNDGWVFETEEKITEAALNSSSCKIMPIDTVMVAMYGGAGTIGKCGLLKRAAATNQAVCSIVTDGEIIDPRYLLDYLYAIRGTWMCFAVGTRKDPNINQQIVNQMKLLLPPLEVQRKIADDLDKKCATIDSLIAEKLALIADLEAYKKLLIFECVTGKCEVA